MGYVETLFGHQDFVLSIDSLRGETAVSCGGRDKTVRFWKIVDETQLVFRGGGRSKLRELLESGALEGMENGDGNEAKKTVEKTFIEGSMECVAMIDETNFVSGGDSGYVVFITSSFFI
jgi:ribosomal RNA-processing protein 9